MTVSSYDDAYSQMLAAVQSFDALVKFGIAVSDETDDQGEHSIVLTASGAADSFSATLCKYITVTEVTSNVQFESAEYGSYVLADGVITQIVTTVDGWTACTNDIAPIKGRLTQTDAEARTSYTNRVASRGTGTVASIVSLLYSDVDGVTFAAGYENYNDTTDAAGRPPHSIEIVVQGGSDEDVANIIWKNKAGGMSVMNIVTACIVILIMAVLSVVAIRFGYKALLIEWAIDAISKAEKEFVGTKLGEARLAVVVSWLREKVPAPIRFLVTDDLIRKAVQTSFNAAKSGLEVLKNA